MISPNGRIQMQAIGELFTVTRQVAPGGEVCYRRLPCYYKRGVVCEVGCNEVTVLLSYIDILAAKKRAYSELARTINCTKDELDQSLTRLSRLREMRESEGSTSSSLSNSSIVGSKYVT